MSLVDKELKNVQTTPFLVQSVEQNIQQPQHHRYKDFFVFYIEMPKNLFVDFKFQVSNQFQLSCVEIIIFYRLF
jgi:hypothetical protein